jgi:hypothetical protein
MNPFKKELAPDFEANTQLPEWVPMGEGSQAPDVSPFVDALKKRMMKPPDAGSVGSMMGGEIGGAGKAAGGMKSL